MCKFPGSSSAIGSRAFTGFAHVLSHVVRRPPAYTLACLITLLALQASAQTRYRIVNLGVLPGETESSAFDINDGGTIVGASGDHGFMYHCIMADLGSLGGGHTIARSLNEENVVVGTSKNAAGQQRAFYWWKGKMHDPGSTREESTATAIDFSGFAVGSESSAGGFAPEAQWFFLDYGVEHFQPIVVNPPNGVGFPQFASGINNRGQVVAHLVNGTANGMGGTSAIGMVSAPAFGGWTRIKGPLNLEQFVFPTAINLNGTVVGRAGSNPFNFHAFLSSAYTNSALDLGTLDPVAANWPREDSFASDINDNGMVVGSAGTGLGSALVAFVYDGTRMIDLSTVLENGAGWFLTTASAINNEGEIVGTGYYQNQQRAYLLIPTTFDSGSQYGYCHIFTGPPIISAPFPF